MGFRAICITIGCLCAAGCATPNGPPISGAACIQPSGFVFLLATHDFAFTSNADGDSEIYLYQAATQSIAKLTDNDVQDHWATWPQDGRRLAFQSLRDENREVYVLDLDTGDLHNLTQHPSRYPK